jgi:hypothetical protein
MSGQCTWASELAKVSCSQAYVDGLLLHIKRLEADIARCHEEHGGFGDSSAMSSMPSDDQGQDIESESSSEEEADIEKLWVPTKNKHLVVSMQLTIRCAEMLINFHSSKRTTTNFSLRITSLSFDWSQSYLDGHHVSLKSLRILI